eukprot:CAMPEP_0113706554 /NCGR_PEP_ID=MMETSP0038_2-20120614/27798_1 /TAXON_ID=2898 /ORGANISM="Cryptomonas paramecium" /LENGTH=34 /DNA_ID=CAMNT_0000631777 /DNA_START=212 /DNA_END=312 /DNA_ORIENTATION=- /assembly_acc=CAM_ASM_000170
MTHLAKSFHLAALAPAGPAAAIAGGGSGMVLDLP